MKKICVNCNKIDLSMRTQKGRGMGKTRDKKQWRTNAIEKNGMKHHKLLNSTRGGIHCLCDTSIFNEIGFILIPIYW